MKFARGLQLNWRSREMHLSLIQAQARRQNTESSVNTKSYGNVTLSCENCEIGRIDQARGEKNGHLETGPPKFSSVTYHSAEMIVFHPLNHVDGTISTAVK